MKGGGDIWMVEMIAQQVRLGLTANAEPLLWRTVLKCHRSELRAQVHRLPSRSGRHPVSCVYEYALEPCERKRSALAALPEIFRRWFSTERCPQRVD